jgi:hypothetical protein
MKPNGASGSSLNRPGTHPAPTTSRLRRPPHHGQVARPQHGRAVKPASAQADPGDPTSSPTVPSALALLRPGDEVVVGLRAFDTTSRYNVAGLSSHVRNELARTDVVMHQD